MSYYSFKLPTVIYSKYFPFYVIAHFESVFVVPLNVAMSYWQKTRSDDGNLETSGTPVVLLSFAYGRHGCHSGTTVPVSHPSAFSHRTGWKGCHWQLAY